MLLHRIYIDSIWSLKGILERCPVWDEDSIRTIGIPVGCCRDSMWIMLGFYQDSVGVI